MFSSEIFLIVDRRRMRALFTRMSSPPRSATVLFALETAGGLAFRKLSRCAG